MDAGAGASCPMVSSISSILYQWSLVLAGTAGTATTVAGISITVVAVVAISITVVAVVILEYCSC